MAYFLDMFGTAVFAIAGALAAGKKQLDLFGVIVLAIVTAVGGGTFRDLVLGAPVFWIVDPNYILVSIGAAIFTFFLARFHMLPDRALSLADAFGLAMFTISGTQKALEFGVLPTIAIMMGMLSGGGGGMVRDVLAGEIPLILRREIYATASILGAGLFIGINFFWPGHIAAPLAGILCTLIIRLAAIRYRLSLPMFIPLEKDK